MCWLHAHDIHSAHVSLQSAKADPSDDEADDKEFGRTLAAAHRRPVARGGRAEPVVRRSLEPQRRCEHVAADRGIEKTVFSYVSPIFLLFLLFGARFTPPLTFGRETRAASPHDTSAAR